MRTDLDADVLAELDKDDIHFTVLGEFDFESGVERLWAGPEGHALSWNSQTWTSLADLGQIDRIAEAQDLADARTTVTLRVNSETVSEIGTDDSRGRDAKIILLILDDEGVPIGPVEFRKTMGAIQVQASARKDAEGAVIVDEALSLDLLDETAILNRSHFVRMTHEAALRIDSNDYGLEFVSDPTIADTGPLQDRRGGRGGGRGRPVVGERYDR